MASSFINQVYLTVYSSWTSSTNWNPSIKLPSEASIDSSFSSVGFSASSAATTGAGFSSVVSSTGFARVFGEADTPFPPLPLFDVPLRATPRPRPGVPFC